MSWSGPQGSQGWPGFGRIFVYTVAWNEEVLMPYFLRHYATIASKIVVYDNGSTDRTPEIVRDCPIAELRPFDTGGTLDNLAISALKNECWKPDRDKADFIIIAEVDEIVWHPNWYTLLSEPATIWRCHGYNMLSQTLPTTTGQIYDEIKEGVRFAMEDKTCLFRAASISAINYGPGAHHCQPQGDVQWGSNRLLSLLHYRWISPEYVIARDKSYVARRSQSDKDRNFGFQYNSHPIDKRRAFDAMWANKQRIVP